jgi:predicted nucleic acid-binding protein
VWELRENLSAYAAVSVALAEVPDGILLTCDATVLLSRAPGLAELVVLIDAEETSP